MEVTLIVHGIHCFALLLMKEKRNFHISQTFQFGKPCSLVRMQRNEMTGVVVPYGRISFISVLLCTAPVPNLSEVSTYLRV